MCMCTLVWIISWFHPFYIVLFCFCNIFIPYIISNVSCPLKGNNACEMLNLSFTNTKWPRCDFHFMYCSERKSSFFNVNEVWTNILYSAASYRYNVYLINFNHMYSQRWRTTLMRIIMEIFFVADHDDPGGIGWCVLLCLCRLRRK